MKYSILFLIVIINLSSKAQILLKYVGNDNPIHLTYNLRELGDEFVILNSQNKTLFINEFLSGTSISIDNFSSKTLIYAEPGDTIKLSFDNNNGLIDYYSNNNYFRKKESNFINHLYSIYGPMISYKSKQRWIRNSNLNDEQLKSALIKNYDDQINSIDQAFNDHEVSDGFRDYFKILLASLEMLNELETNKDNALLESLRKRIKTFPSKESMYVPEFRNLIWEVAFQKLVLNNNDILNNQLKGISIFYENKELDDYNLYRKVLLLFQRNEKSLTKEILKEFEELCSNKEYVKSIKTEFIINTKIDANKSFSSFIKQYKGKPVYVDFWASWCTPCLEEMGYYDNLIASYPNIKFVFISIDKSIVSWQNSEKKFNNFMRNENSFLTTDIKENNLAKELKISTIPRYVLIDSEGNIVNSNAPRPSEERLKIEFDKLK